MTTNQRWWQFCIAGAILGVVPGCLTNDVWRTRSSYVHYDVRAHVVAVEVKGDKLKSFDVVYGGERYHLDVKCTVKEPSSDGAPPAIRWKTKLTKMGDATLPPESEFDFFIPEWNSLARFKWPECESRGRLEIRRMLTENSAESRTPFDANVDVAETRLRKRADYGGKRLSMPWKILLTPVAVAGDILLLPMYVVGGIVYVIAGDSCCH